MFSAPEPGDFVELLLPYFYAGTSCPFLKTLSAFLLETTLGTSHALDRSVVGFIWQFSTTTFTMLAAM
jgi:hypothetical protein